MTSQEIRNWKNQRLNDLEQYDQFKDKQDLLKPYIKVLSDLMLFKSRHHRHKRKVDQERISNTLNVIESFINSIRLNALKGDTTMANNLQFYCITLFDEVANTLDCNDEFAITRSRLIDATEPSHSSTQPYSVHISTSDLAQSKIENEYNSNDFNELGFKLFRYLDKNYQKNGKIKYINIWYYLKTQHKEGEIIFNLTQEGYKNFVQKYNNIEIKKFAKSEYLYDDKELPILNELGGNFFKSLK